MEILKPETYWIGNRCYRVNPSSNSNQNNYTSYPVDDEKPERDGPSLKPYVEADEFEDDANGFEENEIVAENVEVVKENGGYKAICSIPSSLFRNIIGFKGAKKKRVELETRTRIVVPRPNEKGHIVVRGQNEIDVIKAFKRLDQIATFFRFKRDATHFACFSLNTPHVIEKAKEFKQKVLEECGLYSRGLDQSIFQQPEKLHLTICVMVLLDERERSCAADLLSSLQPEIKQITAGQPLKVKLKGLEIMNDDPSQVDVLYAKCEPVPNTDAIQRIADLVAMKFGEKGLGKETRGEKVKLHCTVINTRYRSEADVPTSDTRDQEDNQRGQSGNSRESFDARQVLQKFGDFDFGTVDVTEVKIATRYTQRSDGFYKCYTSVSL